MLRLSALVSMRVLDCSAASVGAVEMAEAHARHDLEERAVAELVSGEVAEDARAHVAMASSQPSAH